MWRVRIHNAKYRMLSTKRMSTSKSLAIGQRVRVSEMKRVILNALHTCTQSHTDYAIRCQCQRHTVTEMSFFIISNGLNHIGHD